MILKDDHWEELYMFAKDLADHKIALKKLKNNYLKKRMTLF
jgi:hypothetical protein